MIATRSAIGDATPCVESARLGTRHGIDRLFFKLESCQPTGSYKDRFIAAALRALVDRGVTSCMATSSGNTGAALAAGCARHGMACRIFVSEQVPAGKLQQMEAHGARVFRVEGFTVRADVTARVWHDLEVASRRLAVPLIVSAYRHCPDGMAGVEALAAELVRQTGPLLRHVFVPVGGGGLFTAVCRGMAAAGHRVRVHAVQPEGCPTIVDPFRRGDRDVRPVRSTTAISGLSVPFDIDATLALDELARGGGFAIGVTDGEIYEAQRSLMREEGIWAEPAGATALAGCLRARREGRIAAGEPVACIITGHGFKDPESTAAAVSASGARAITADDLASVLEEEGR